MGKKVTELKDCLVSTCRDEDVRFTNYTQVIDAMKNLNNSKLHLNTKGPIKMHDNLVKYLRGISCRNNNARNYPGSSNGIDKTGEALSCVSNVSPMEESNFGTSSEGMSFISIV